MRAPRIMSARFRDASRAIAGDGLSQLILNIGVAVFGIVGVSGSLDFFEGILDLVDERGPEGVGFSFAFGSGSSSCLEVSQPSCEVVELS